MTQVLMLTTLVVACIVIAVLTAVGQIGWFDGMTTLIPCVLVVTALGLKRLGYPKV